MTHIVEVLLLMTIETPLSSLLFSIYFLRTVHPATKEVSRIMLTCWQVRKGLVMLAQSSKTFQLLKYKRAKEDFFAIVTPYRNYVIRSASVPYLNVCLC